MEYEVLLRLHQDDANGEWGLCHSNAIGKFNAFWGADGIFHDVFEHYFEDEHKYFSGCNAFTMYGEMCASGHGIAYADLGINNFRYRNNSSRDFTVDTTSQMEDWLAGHNEDYGPEYDIRNYKVPKQVIKHDYNSLKYWLNQYEDWLMRERNEKVKIHPLSIARVRNCYNLGFKTANKIIGKDQDYSYKVLDDFLKKMESDHTDEC